MILVNIDMPVGCKKCPMCYGDYCCITMRGVGSYKKMRPNACPIVGVPVSTEVKKEVQE